MFSGKALAPNFKLLINENQMECSTELNLSILDITFALESMLYLLSATIMEIRNHNG